MSHFVRRLGFASVPALLAVLAAPCVRADDPKPPSFYAVGTTHDMCRDPKYVRFQIHNGEAKVEKGPAHLFRLSGKKKEMTWYCGDSPERVANDKEFNWVRIQRHQNGGIDWEFYRHD